NNPWHFKPTAGELRWMIEHPRIKVAINDQFMPQAFGLIAQGKSAAFAWQSATHETATLFKGLGNRLLAERAL
ncbi:hypothetical protein L0N33_24885, partial [Roseburia faecis]|nr:hypothetical protein [Roseburia faecis]